MADERTGTVETAGGLRIFFRCREADASRGSVLVIHGLGEHSGRYGALADALVSAGVDTYAMDLRGHGRSQGRRGHADSFDRLLQDVDRVRRRVRMGRPAVPAFILGHSLGGLVVGRYVQEFGFPSLAGAVLVAPLLDLAMEPPAWKTRLARVADRLAPALTVDNELRTAEVFRDPEEQDRYDRDPLVHRRLSVRLWSEIRRAAALLLRRAEHTRVPFLLQLPGADRVVSSPASRAMASRLAGSVTVSDYPEAYHGLYHDPSSGTALGDLVEWLEPRLAGGVSAAGEGLV
jgi:alpha-beta hydrolase superfamily lysophospholipase